MSTAFQRKNIHKGTWSISGGETTNQIDHVLVNRRRKSSILDVRFCRSTNCDSDHYLMKIKVRYKISASLIAKGVRRLKWEVGKLESNELTKEYQRNIADSLLKSSNYESTSVDEDWKNIKCAILRLQAK